MRGSVLQGRPYAGVLAGRGRPSEAPEPELGQQTRLVTAVQTGRLGSRGLRAPIPGEGRGALGEEPPTFLRLLGLPGVSTFRLSLLQMSPLHKDTTYIGLGPTLL